MSKHIARDSTLWNRFVYGDSRYIHYLKSDISSEKLFYQKKPELPMRKLLTILLFTLTAVLCFNGISKRNSPFHGYTNGGYQERSGLFASRPGTSISAIGEQNGPHEIIEVSFPFVPSKRYGQSLHQELLVNDTFDSWGNPFSGQYLPPKGVNFNRVVLTLHVNITEIQYDRLAHFFIGGAEVWRTSTIEPNGGEVYSVFKKDLSSYLALFKEENQILFQLDNTVTDSLKGKPHVQLYADFYKEPENNAELFEQVLVNHTYTDERYKIFDIRKPADHVYPLIKQKDKKTPPTENLPGSNITVSLPRIPQNTTRLKLSVFTSGNGDEEFWYTNVLDKYTDLFQKSGTTLPGHGPLRVLNVYFNGQKIAAQTQQPFIFTGGISPSFWNPVVAVSTFDLSSIDLDITGLLPSLWNSDTQKLSIEVSNGIDEFQGLHSGIGDNWITAAHLLTYENADVILASGRISHIGHHTKGDVVAYAIRGGSSLSQVIDGVFKAELTSDLAFQLKNGKSLNTTVSSFTEAKISNVQHYGNSGKNSQIVHDGKSSKSFLLLENGDENSEIHRTNVSFNYPVVLNQNSKPISDGQNNNIQIVYSKTSKLDIDGHSVMAEAIVQNGTSIFYERKSGNSGTADLDTKYKIQVLGPKLEYIYQRKVKGSNGQITSDEHNFIPNVSSWSEIEEEIAQISKTNSTTSLASA